MTRLPNAPLHGYSIGLLHHTGNAKQRNAKSFKTHGTFNVRWDKAAFCIKSFLATATQLDQAYPVSGIKLREKLLSDF